MADRYIPDTHALVWYLEGNPLLGIQAKAVIDDSESRMILPVIALAEAAYIIEKGRTAIPAVSDLLAAVHQDERIKIYPLTLKVFQRSQTAEAFRIPELHDRFIVSTGLCLTDAGYSVAILTKDGVIVNSGVLSVVW